MRSFQIYHLQVYDGDVESAVTSLKTYRYNSEDGPLWCARLIHGYTYPPASQWPIAESPLRPDTGIDLPSQDISMASPHPDPGGDTSWSESLGPDTSASLSTRPDTGLGLDPTTGCVPLQPGEIVVANQPNPPDEATQPLQIEVSKLYG